MSLIGSNIQQTIRIWLIILVARGVMTTIRSTKLRSSRTFPAMNSAVLRPEQNRKIPFEDYTFSKIVKKNEGTGE